LGNRSDLDEIRSPAHSQVGEPVVLGFTASSTHHYLPACGAGKRVGPYALGQCTDLVELQEQCVCCFLGDGVIYAGQRVDITDKILERLRADYKSGAQ